MGGISLSRLLAPHLEVEAGGATGTCYVCGETTGEGFAQKPSDNFTLWAYCFAGDVLCPPCRALLRDRRLRSRSWIATPSSLLLRDADTKEQFFQALLSPPSPPLAVYVTRGGQRQGYLPLMWRVTLRDLALWVGTDWTPGPVLLPLDWARQVAPLLLRLRERGLPRQPLMDGQIGAKTWKEAITQGWEDDLRRARELAGDPRWEVMVVACP